MIAINQPTVDVACSKNALNNLFISFFFDQSFVMQI